MSNGNELQNNEFILPGNLGTVIIGDKEREITQVYRNKINGSVTITIGATKPEPLLVDGHSTGLMIYHPEAKFTEQSTTPKQLTDGTK
jgi:hypothetical protein